MSAGIVGGADGPTSVFVTSSFGWSFALGAAMALLAGLVSYLTIRV